MTLILLWHPPVEPFTLRWRIPAATMSLPPRRAQPALAAVIGPPGPSGARYIHRQAVAAAEWIVNHDLGAEPAGVSIRSPGNVEVIAEVAHVSVNQLRVLFAGPARGSVVIL